MSVTAPQGFEAAGVAVGLKSTGKLDVRALLDGLVEKAPDSADVGTPLEETLRWLRERLAGLLAEGAFRHPGAAAAALESLPPDRRARLHTRAAELKQNYDLRMAGAREEADQLMKKTVASANLRSDAIIDDAQKQAANMMRRAESEIEQERVKAFAEVKKEISGMAVDIAEQMVSREIKAEDHAELVDEFIRNAGEDA